MVLGDIWSGYSEDEPEVYLFSDAVDNIAAEYGESIAQQVGNDQWVQFLYHEAMWDFEIPADYRGNAYDAFVEYMEENYDIEWEDVYDWDAYRAAYDAA